MKNDSIPKEVSTAISNLMKFIEKSESDYIDSNNNKEEQNENK
jgi:hypothetical protein